MNIQQTTGVTPKVGDQEKETFTYFKIMSKYYLCNKNNYNQKVFIRIRIKR